MQSIATPQAFFRDAERFLVFKLGAEKTRAIMRIGSAVSDPHERVRFLSAVVDDVASETVESLSKIAHYNSEPVGIEEFIYHPKLLNTKANTIWPAVMPELVEFNNGSYVEGVLTGGIGCAKTTVALYTNAYQLYLLSCLRDPHALYGQDKSAELLLIFQSISAHLAKVVDFARFRAMIANSPYFKEHFPFDKDLESKLVFPNRIEVVPVSGLETAAIGQNVIGGLIDEMNYMQIIEKSKQSFDQGTYDQAIALYNSIARRRKTRFMSHGKLPGILCLVSSKKYPGQFTDQKQDEAKTDPTIFVYDKRAWDVKPPGTFSGERFYMFTGDLTRSPKILDNTDDVPEKDRPLVITVPVEFKTEFQKDPINSLRELAGISMLSHHPFFLDVEAVTGTFGKTLSIFSQPVVDFVETGLAIYPKVFFKPELPRFAHVDLAVTGDSAGLAIGCCPGFVNMKAKGFGDENELMPLIRFDGLLQIKPPRNGEILFWKIRKILLDLRKMGLNIQWITFDAFQSNDSVQLLRQQGFMVGVQSMDRVVRSSKRAQYAPYDFFKSAVYTGRVQAPAHKAAQIEIVSLEKDAKTGKIDHPVRGSKDVADAMCGVTFGLTMRREVWAMYGVPIWVPPGKYSTGIKESQEDEDAQ